jgi:hypothetical protein
MGASCSAAFYAGTRHPTHADYPIHRPAIPSQRKLQILRPLWIPGPTGGREDGLGLRGTGRREIDPHVRGDGGERRGSRRRRGWGIYGGWNAAADQNDEERNESGAADFVVVGARVGSSRPTNYRPLRGQHTGLSYYPFFYSSFSPIC